MARNILVPLVILKGILIIFLIVYVNMQKLPKNVQAESNENKPNSDSLIITMPQSENASRELQLSPQSPDVDWNKRFDFVPNNVENCNELFGGKEKTMPPKFKEEFEQYMKDYKNITSHLKGIKFIEGYTAQVPVAHRAYVEIASHTSVKTICETGFNAGHSTFSWLATNPNAQVYSFDLGIHAYSRPMANHIMKLYPDRFHVTWGNSMKTLPDFQLKYPNVTCDVMIIDGGHQTSICKSDFLNFKRMASVNNVIIMDNYPQNSWGFMKTLGDCWESAKKNAQVAEIFNCYVPGKGKSDFGFSVGRM